MVLIHSMNPWHDITPGKEAPAVINTIIEIPKGSRMKYELHKESGMIMLDRVSHTTNVYPGDYGFMPQSYWEDGDPLDVMVLCDDGVVPNTLTHVRVIGVLHMVDDGESDDKILGVYDDDPRYDNVRNLSDISQHRLDEIQHYFETYKGLQDKKVEVTGCSEVDAAHEAVKKSMRLYKER